MKKLSSLNAMTVIKSKTLGLRVFEVCAYAVVIITGLIFGGFLSDTLLGEKAMRSYENLIEINGSIG